METSQDIIVAIQRLARKLEGLEAALVNDCQYYQLTLEELKGTELNQEQLILLGSYLATYQLAKTFDLKKDISAPSIPECLKTIVNEHFGVEE